MLQGPASQGRQLGVITPNREHFRLALHKEATTMKITNLLLIVAAAGTLVACDKSTPDTAAPDVAAPEAPETPETPAADDVTDEESTDEAAEESADEADAVAPTAEE